MKRFSNQTSSPLTHLTSLVIDCQATGPKPANGYLLEIAWSRIQVSEPFDPVALPAQSFVVRLPEGKELPARVARVTGIKACELSQAKDDFWVWRALDATAREVMTSNQQEKCPAVVHFSRFEEPFLRHLYLQTGGMNSFPLEIICTHAIWRRLFPELPRKGLRAVAGYLGHSVPEKRRSLFHVVATAVIWRESIRLLDEVHGIRTLEELLEWLRTPVQSTKTCREYPMKPQLRRRLPDQPGVYRFYRSNGDILYVGKARWLKKRVNTYFQKHARHPEHILEMLSQARDVDVTVTGSALEAALLEVNEIRRLSPPYNVALRQKERSLFFSCWRFQQFAPQPTPLHRLGPFPSSVRMRPLGNLLRCLHYLPARNYEIWEDCEIFDIHQSPPPERECLDSGVMLFSQRHALEIGRNPSVGVLFRLGKKLWEEERIAHRDGSPGDSKVGDDEQGKITAEWTPEKVAALFERIIMWGVYYARRARWYCLLSESSITWTRATSEDPRSSFLVLTAGCVLQRGFLSTACAVPVPPGYRKSTCMRQAAFDTATYDRMRVLTTELRRKVRQGCQVRVCLTPTVTLSAEQLAGLLRWV